MRAMFKKLTISSANEMIRASRDPNTSEISVAPGDYGWISIHGADGLTIKAADPDNPPIFQHIGLHGSKHTRLICLVVAFGATRNPSARAVEINRCRDIEIRDCEISGPASPGSWRSFPNGILVADSARIRIENCRFNRLANMIKLQGVTHSIKVTESESEHITDADMPAAVESVALPVVQHKEIDAADIVVWRGRRYRVVRTDVAVLVPMEEKSAGSRGYPRG